MSPAVVVLAGLSAGTYLLKSAGPLLLGNRRLPPTIEILANRTPAALLAALVMVSAVADGRSVMIDERVFGVAAAAVALRLRVPFVVVVVLAVATTATARALL